MTPFAGSRADFRRFGAPAGHADLRGAVDDRGDAGGGTFRRDVEGGAGILGLELLGELRHEFRAERVGAFDDELLGARFRGDESEPESEGDDESDFHKMRLSDVDWSMVRISSSGRPERVGTRAAG